MRLKYPHLAGFAFMTAALGGPFVARSICEQFEIYPSVVLPSGGVLVRSNGEAFVFTRIEVLGHDAKTGALRPVDPQGFLSPIPAGYFLAVVANEFGLNPNFTATLYLRGGRVLTRREFGDMTDADRDATRAWLRERLQREGFGEDELIVRKTRMRAVSRTGAVEATSVVDEKRFKLR